jgi:hypothetical protein
LQTIRIWYLSRKSRPDVNRESAATRPPAASAR